MTAHIIENMEALIPDLLKLTEEQFQQEKARNVDNMKRLYAKAHRLNVEVNKTDREIEYYEEFWQREKKSLSQKLLYNEQINSLMLYLEELEKKNIDLENQCLSVPKKDNTPMIVDIVEEFFNKYLEEKAKNKKIGLYIKKEFINSKNEESEKLKMETKEVNEDIQRELERIRELENRENELIQNISVLERMIAEKKKSGTKKGDAK